MEELPSCVSHHRASRVRLTSWLQKPTPRTAHFPFSRSGTQAVRLCFNMMGQTSTDIRHEPCRLWPFAPISSCRIDAIGRGLWDLSAA
jgi:hypothetical protein